MIEAFGPFRKILMAVTFVALLAVTACAQQSPGSPATSNTPAADRTDLTITVTDSPGEAPQTFRLIADGNTEEPATTVADPAAALAALALHGEEIFFPPSAPPKVCTEQYGGSQVATVTGWFKSRQVTATFNLTNGCEIARWQALTPLFGTGGTI